MRSVTGRPTLRPGTMLRRLTALVLLVSAVGAAFAVVDSAGRVGSSSAGSALQLRKTPLGRVLADGRGRTLYLFEADEYGLSACSGKCATFWPPLLTRGAPRAGAGVHAGLIGTTKRSGGGLQVTYAGYPVYRFVKDAKPGQAAGQGVDGFGAEWYVLDALGRKIEDSRHGGDPAVVTVRDTALAPALVDGRGRTLYLFEADEGTRSHCYGKCAQVWPPLLTHGKPQAGAGAIAALLRDAKRRDGSLQVTYNGHPLYYFAKDGRAGQTLGEGIDGFGGEWYALDAAGKKLEHGGGSSGSGETAADTSTDSSSGGGSYG